MHNDFRKILIDNSMILFIRNSRYFDKFLKKVARKESSRLFKMVHIYLIVLFEAFNKDFFTTLLSTKPNCMKTASKKLNYEEIIGFESIEELHEFLALQITDQFGRQNIDQFAKFVNTKFKLDVTSKFKDWNKLREKYYCRNLVVHNKSRVSNDYIKLINGFGPNDIDKELKIDYPYISDCINHIWKYIELIFEEIAIKFKLKITPKNVFDLDFPEPLLFEDLE
ncbi:hypothetical protein ES703_86694 [subsurface metagenome]